MKTKLVSEWKLSKQESEAYGIDSDQIQMFRNLLKKDCELFVDGKGLNSPNIELLTKFWSSTRSANPLLYGGGETAIIRLRMTLVSSGSPSFKEGVSRMFFINFLSRINRIL